MSHMEDRRRLIEDLVGEPAEPPRKKGGRPRKDGKPPGSVPPKPKRPPGRPRKDGTPAGSAPPVRRPRAEPVAQERRPLPKPPDEMAADRDVSKTLSSTDVSAFLLYGASVQQLARLFRMTRPGVEKKLRNLRPIDLGAHGNPVYDISEAAGYLIPPKIDLEEYLASIKPEQLPDHLRETFWNAKLKRQRYEVNAGDLWRTKRVMEVVGELLLDFSSKLALIPDLVERQTGFSPEQYRLVRSIVDSVREEMVDSAERMRLGEDVTSQLDEKEDEA